MICLKRLITCGSLFLLFLLAACSGSSGNTPTNPNSSSHPYPTEQSVYATMTAASSPSSNPATPSTPSTPSPTKTSQPGTGPIIILSPTPVAGGNGQGQAVTLPDRTLIIQSVSKQVGNTAQSTAISLTMTMQNSSGNAIQNQATYFQLVGAGGDSFGLQSSATASFFGSIAPHSSRSGTIVFQVPNGVVSGIKLFYRSEIASETVFVALHV